MNYPDFGKTYLPDSLKAKLSTAALTRNVIFEAPSGFGKSTAMRSFLNIYASSNSVIHSYTAVRDAHIGVYRSFCKEISAIDPCAGKKLLEIDFPNALTLGDACEALRSIDCEQETWFAIDEFHHLYPALHSDMLKALLDNNNNNLRVIIATQKLGHAFHINIVSRGITPITSSDLQWDAADVRNYFKLMGEKITRTQAKQVVEITDGWIIAVYFQLCAYKESGTFSNEALNHLVEHVIWDRMSLEQREFCLRMSAFGSCTISQICAVLEVSRVPSYVKEIMRFPLLCYNSMEEKVYPHEALVNFVLSKLYERGRAFVKRCYVQAGDICKEEGSCEAALRLYSKISDYERILSLEFPSFVSYDVGDSIFYNVALDISKNCPHEVRKKHLKSMLCVAWALRLMENIKEFASVMDELDGYISHESPLRAEWTLLSVYLHFPNLEKMIPIASKAKKLFNGKVSQIILPQAPWAFYEYLQLSGFHLNVGDADMVAEALDEFIEIYSSLTSGHGRGANISYRAQLAFFRCDMVSAEMLAYKASYLAKLSSQETVYLGATRILASIAIVKSDFDGWQSIVQSVENAVVSPANTAMFQTMLEVFYALILAQLSDYDKYPTWLKTGDISQEKLPYSIYYKAVMAHGYYLLDKGEYPKLVAYLETVPVEDNTPFAKHVHYIAIAAGHYSMGNKAAAERYMKLAAAKSIPDGLLHYFTSFSGHLGGMSDELMKNKYPDMLKLYEQYRDSYHSGWLRLHSALKAKKLAHGLTEREREIAILAADGLRNSEIAQKMFISESTVRAHLRSIYAKLDIDRRAKLAALFSVKGSSN